MSADKLPEFFLLTGFLGSGKTTLLVDLLSLAQFQDTGVIVNEIGEIDIDGATIATASSGLQIARLSNGCVCCSMMSTLPMTVAALMDENERLGRSPLTRIILETSGLSRPAPIIRQLLGLPLPFRVTVVSTYDSVQGALASQQYEEASAQIAAAHTLVLTKTDQVDAAGLQAAHDAVAALNPLARVVSEERGELRARAAFRAEIEGVQHLVRIADADRAPSPMPHGRSGVFLARPDASVDLDSLLEWLDNLAGCLGPRLLRIKGVVSLRGGHGSVLLQSVGTVFDPPRRVVDTGMADAIVIIARDTSCDELAGLAPDLLIDIRDTRRPRLFAALQAE